MLGSSTDERVGERPREWGEAISAAKRGRPLVARSENEITRQEAVREFGLSAKVLVEGANRQLQFERGEVGVRRGLRHRRLPHSTGGVVLLFDRVELAEDLARLSCQWCDQPAPGDSGRCRRHQAKKYAAVELVCAWGKCPRKGEPFLRYGSVHRYRGDRGDKHTFCSDRCELLWQKENDSRFRSPHAPFDSDYAHERFDRLEKLFAEERKERGLPLDVSGLAVKTHTSPSVIRAHAAELGGEVIMVEGAKQLAFPEDAEERYARVWAGRPEVSDAYWSRYRERFVDVDWLVLQQERMGRLKLRADEAALRERTAARRLLFTPKRKGRRRRGAPPAKHFQWERRFSDVEADLIERYEAYHVDGDRPPSQREAARQLADEVGATPDAVRMAVERVRAWRAANPA